jgi:hypothetical protein
MPSDRNTHIPLKVLWAHRKDNTELSDGQFEHLYQCNDCLADLGMCHISQTIEQVGRLKRGGRGAG